MFRIWLCKKQQFALKQLRNKTDACRDFFSYVDEHSIGGFTLSQPCHMSYRREAESDAPTIGVIKPALFGRSVTGYHVVTP